MVPHGPLFGPAAGGLDTVHLKFDAGGSRKSPARPGGPTMSTAARTHRPAAPARAFLRPTPVLPDKLDFDTARRFGLATQLLDRLLTGLPGPVKVLDVGCNVLNL